MDVEKGSRLWEANAAAFRILKAHHEINSDDEMQAYFKAEREFEQDYHEFTCMFGSYFFFFLKKLDNEWALKGGKLKKYLVFFTEPKGGKTYTVGEVIARDECEAKILKMHEACPALPWVNNAGGYGKYEDLSNYSTVVLQEDA